MYIILCSGFEAFGGMKTLCQPCKNSGLWYIINLMILVRCLQSGEWGLRVCSNRQSTTSSAMSPLARGSSASSAGFEALCEKFLMALPNNGAQIYSKREQESCCFNENISLFWIWQWSHEIIARVANQRADSTSYHCASFFLRASSKMMRL